MTSITNLFDYFRAGCCGRSCTWWKLEAWECVRSSCLWALWCRLLWICCFFPSLKYNESLRPAYIMGKLNSLDTTSLIFKILFSCSSCACIPLSASTFKSCALILSLNQRSNPKYQDHRIVQAELLRSNRGSIFFVGFRFVSQWEAETGSVCCLPSLIVNTVQTWKCHRGNPVSVCWRLCSEWRDRKVPGSKTTLRCYTLYWHPVPKVLKTWSPASHFDAYTRQHHCAPF